MIELAPRETEIWTDSFEDAKLYCFSLVVDGKIGWRLPTKQELTFILETDDTANWIWYWCDADKYLPPQNLSVRAVRTVDNQ